MFNILTRLGVLAVVTAVVGCGGAKYHPVKGQVQFPDGSPVTGLDGGQVVFEGTRADGKAVSATGTVDAEGRFVMGTEAPGDGAAPGKNRVLIAPPTTGGDVPAKRVIDRKYESFDTSGLEFDVKPGANEFNPKVDRAGK